LPTTYKYRAAVKGTRPNPDSKSRSEPVSRAASDDAGPSVIVRSLGALLKEVEKQIERWDFDESDNNRPWYRGQADSTRPLYPSSLRGRIWDADARSDEQEAFEEFITKAPALGAPESLRSHVWDTYFLMQHYEAPTRLLDWTESVLVAAYFAVTGEFRKSDAVIWMLDPYRLNGNNSSFKHKFVYSPEFIGNNKRERQMLDKWLPRIDSAKPKRIPKPPLAIYPAYLARRIESQKSAFTIHGSDREGLMRLWRKDGALSKLIIPVGKRRTFRTQLREMGIDTATIYPDLSGLGKLLAEKWGPQKH
jgi:FRG domain